MAEAETRITDRPIAQGIKKFPQISPAGIVKALQHHSDRRPARMGAKETILVCPILGEQRGQALAVIYLPRWGVSGNIGVRNYRTSVIASFQAIEYLITISLGRHLSDLLGIVLIASGALRRSDATPSSRLEVGMSAPACEAVRPGRTGGAAARSPSDIRSATTLAI
jgi:hypothetical protein